MLACKDNECKPQRKFVPYVFIFPLITHSLPYPATWCPCAAPTPCAESLQEQVG